MNDNSGRKNLLSEPSFRRLPVESAGYYYFEPGTSKTDSEPMLMGFHGYGQTGKEFLEVIRNLAPPGFSLVAPQGLNQIWNPKTNEITFSWMSSFEREDGIRTNNHFLASVIDELRETEKIDPMRVILLGFSQGSSVAYRFAAKHPEKICGLISVCSDLPPDVESDLELLRKIPVLVLYTPDDRWVPPEKPREAVAALKSAGVEAEAISFRGKHRVPGSLADRIRDWISRYEPK